MNNLMLEIFTRQFALLVSHVASVSSASVTDEDLAAFRVSFKGGKSYFHHNEERIVLGDAQYLELYLVSLGDKDDALLTEMLATYVNLYAWYYDPNEGRYIPELGGK